MDFFDLTDTPTERIYQAMGQFIVDAIPEEWLSATAYAEIEEDDNGLTYGRYVPAAAPESIRDFDAAAELYLAFDELRRRFRKPGYAPWSKAQFTLQRNGHFDLDFTYPDDGQTPQQITDFDGLLSQIQREFSFLVDEHAFAAGELRRAGDTTSVQYQHLHMIIQFSVLNGEWQALVWPAATGQQARQVKLDDLVTYLTRPPIDFAADQARPGLSQSEALSQLARQLAPIAGDMLALFDPARWPATWADIQAVLQARSAERARQFRQWRQSALSSE
jgi:hypothetical protein